MGLPVDVGLVVGVDAGLLLLRSAVGLSELFSLSLLATVRGGTSFLCPKRQRNEAKKALSNNRQVSVPSVQAKSFWHLIARCSPDLRMFEPLLLANPDTNTLRPQRSRARTVSREPTPLYPMLHAASGHVFFVKLVS